MNNNIEDIRLNDNSNQNQLNQCRNVNNISKQTKSNGTIEKRNELLQSQQQRICQYNSDHK